MTKIPTSGIPLGGTEILDAVDREGVLRRIYNKEPLQDRLERLAGACLDFSKPQQSISALPQRYRAGADFAWPRRHYVDDHPTIGVDTKTPEDRAAIRDEMRRNMERLNTITQAGPWGDVVMVLSALNDVLRGRPIDVALAADKAGVVSWLDEATTSVARLPGHDRATRQEPLEGRARILPEARTVKEGPSTTLLIERGVVSAPKPEPTRPLSPEHVNFARAAADLARAEPNMSNRSRARELKYGRNADALKHWLNARPQAGAEERAAAERAFNATIEEAFREHEGPVPATKAPTTHEELLISPTQEKVLGQALGQYMRRSTPSATEGGRLIERLGPLWDYAVTKVHGSPESMAETLSARTANMGDAEAARYARDYGFQPVRQAFMKELYRSESLRQELADRTGLKMSQRKGYARLFVEALQRGGVTDELSINVDHGRTDLAEAVKLARRTGDRRHFETIVDPENLRLTLPLENQAVFTRLKLLEW